MFPLNPCVCTVWCSAIDLVQIRMLTAQFVAAVPPFVLVAGCVVRSIFICWRSKRLAATSKAAGAADTNVAAAADKVNKVCLTAGEAEEAKLAAETVAADAAQQYQLKAVFFQSLLPPALLVIGLQGLLGALVWPAISLLAFTAYLGSVNPHTDKQQGSQPGSVIFGISVLLCASIVMGLLFLVLATFGLWWGTAWVAIVCIGIAWCRTNIAENVQNEIGKPTMCLAYTSVLASFWAIDEIMLPLILGGNSQPAEDNSLFSLQRMCEQVYQPDGTEFLGDLLDMDVSGWDIALFLALLLHRHRLRRRGEWSLELNSDLNGLAERLAKSQRPFALFPPTTFWDRSLLNPLKQHVAVWVQKSNQNRTEALGFSFSTWCMISGLFVLAAVTLAILCVFDDIPVGFNENTGGKQWSIEWTGHQDAGSCLSENGTYLKVLAGVILFFSTVGLLSWAAVCEVQGVEVKGVSERWRRLTVELLECGSAPDDDGYIPMLCWQLLALPLVVALYFQRTGQSASQISQSVTESSTVPTSIVALGCGVFLLIIVDRAVYMCESSRCKLLLLWATMLAFCAFWITNDSDDPSNAEGGEGWTGDWAVWLMIACCMYFYQSAVQLEIKLMRNPERRFTRYENVPGDKNTWVHTFRTPIRKTPFLMELVYLVSRLL